MERALKKSNLFSDEIVGLIRETRQKIYFAVNEEISLLYWKIGKRISEEVLGNERAEYGKSVIKNLSKKLTEEFGSGWSEKQLLHCLRTAETFADDEFFSALRRELSWTHIKTLIQINDDIIRNFNIELLQLDKSNIKVADYLTVLPPRKLLQEKLHKAIEIARNKVQGDSNQ